MRNTISKTITVISFCLFAVLNVYAQKDSLLLKNKNIIVGEIKSLDGGVMVIKTPYSKDDFRIEWKGVKELYTPISFLIIMAQGTRFNGPLRSVAGTDSVEIKDLILGKQTVALNDIVFLKSVRSKFWSRVDATIDVGLSLARANHLKQYNMSSSFQYLANKWQANATYTDNRSKQDDVDQTKRTEATAEFKYFLQHNWFANSSLDFLSNTEQALNLRTTGRLGAGRYLVHTNKSYWGLGGGASFNVESFTNGTNGRNSLEAYGGMELNIFDVKNLDLLSNLYVYRSFTESGRWRTDFKFNIKYDLPFDFYIKPGLSLNYDNRPAVAGKTTDYVATFAIGWELK